MFETKVCDRVQIVFAKPTAYFLERGIGVNWHHNWVPAGARQDAVTEFPDFGDELNWPILLDALSVTRPSCIRFGYPAQRFVSGDGSIDFDSEGFRALERLDNWASDHGCIICFDPWPIAEAATFGTLSDGNLPGTPREPQRYVDDFLIPIMDHIQNCRCLSTVQDFIIINETITAGSASGPGVLLRTSPELDHLAFLVPVHELLKQRMREKALQFNLIGPNSNSTQYWAIDSFRDRNLDLTPFIDAYDQHSYEVRFDYLPPNPTIATTNPVSDSINNQIRTNARFARSQGKPYYLTELGTRYYGWQRGDRYGPARHDSMILEAELIIRSMAVGVGGFYRWAFVAPGSYADGVCGFLTAADGSYSRQPNTFYGYAALMRYCEIGSWVWVPNSTERPNPYQHVHAVGLGLPGGEATLLIVNNHWCQERVLEIEIPPHLAKLPFQRFLVDSTRKMHRLELGLRASFQAVMPPMSIMVFTSARHPGDSDFPADIDVHTAF